VYLFVWGNDPRRAELKGRECVVICRGTMNGALVEFLDNGERVVISRSALRRRDRRAPAA
jgi:hypothetical protein